MSNPEIWARLELLISPTAIHFFCAFSRFEYALKRLSYISISTNGTVKPNWNLYAKHLGKPFFESIKGCIPTKLLFLSPPQKQTAENGKLNWTNVSPPQNSEELFSAVCRVRNNLFHGGKYPYRPIEEPGRNDELITACLHVLEEAIKTDKRMESTYWEA